MINRENTIIIAVSLIISFIIWFTNTNEQQTQQNRFSVKTFKSDQGWGYDILVNKKLFIHQELIPALQGSGGFKTKIQAEQTARLIINKLERGELPTVTTFELETILSPNNQQHDQPGATK